MTPYPYQLEAMDALHFHLCNKPGNPCVVIPTGGGKSPFMAWVIQRYMQDHPPLRVAVLAHVMELVEQNAEKMRTIWPDAPLGIYSAGLRSRDMLQPITFASIQSVYKKACSFQPFDIIFIDEAHRVPFKGEGLYRRFISEAQLMNPKVVVVGVTATPFRLDGGPICGKKNILNEICYEANVKDLIDGEYLCRLTTKSPGESIDTQGIHIRQGEFVTAELMQRAGGKDKVSRAVAEAMRLGADRKSMIFFCINVEHAISVSNALASHGVDAPVIEANTDLNQRKQITEDFKAGRIRAICNVNCLTEGFDAQRVDCIALMRPTMSAGLFYQMVGRGLRKHDSKQNTLVIDLAGNTMRHGPIDLLKPKGAPSSGDGEAPAKVCPSCLEVIHAAALVCPECGYEFPPREIKHDVKASTAPIISVDLPPWVVEIRNVEASRYQKEGRPPILKVVYEGTSGDGNLADYESHIEWVALEGEGFAIQKARRWWERRFGHPVPSSVDEALCDGGLFLGERVRALTERITVKREAGSRYTRVVGVTLRNEAGAMATFRS